MVRTTALFTMVSTFCLVCVSDRISTSAAARPGFLQL